MDRAISEIVLDLAQNEGVTDWRLAVWVPRPRLLPALPAKYRLLAPHITIVALNQLPTGSERSLGINLIDLILCPASQASEKVVALRTRLQNLTEPTLQKLLIDLMETVLVYKFLSLQEMEAMFGLSELKQTRVYQEAREEGKQEGMQIGRQEGVRLGEAQLPIRQLSRRFGTLSLSQQERIRALPLEELECLGEAFLDWQSPADWPDWLREA